MKKPKSPGCLGRTTASAAAVTVAVLCLCSPAQTQGQDRIEEKKEKPGQPTEREAERHIGKHEKEELLRQEFMSRHSDEHGRPRPDLWRKGIEDFKRLGVASAPAAAPSLARPRAASLPVSGAQWTQIGPAPLYIDDVQIYQGQGPNGGEVTDLAIDPRGTNDQVLYITSNDGGVWKTTDGGLNWKPLTDYLPSLSMGAVCLDAGNPDIVYAGSGNAFNNGFFKGMGVFRSTDAGDTWMVPDASSAMNNQSIQRIVSPAANVILVGTFTFSNAPGGNLSKISGGNLFKSVDGGLHYGNDTPNFTNGNPVLSGAISDIDIDTGDPTRIYASVAGQGIFLSTNTGTTFPSNIFTNNKVIVPLAAGGVSVFLRYGYISLAQSTKPDNKILYANVATGTNSFIGTDYKGTKVYTWFRGIFKSVDRGATWFQLPIPTNIVNDLQASLQMGYDQTIGVDPANSNRVYIGFPQLYVSTNGGTNFTVPAISSNWLHWDHHAIVFSPTGHVAGVPPTRLWVGTDGGIDCSTNGGTTWLTNLNKTLATTLFRGIDIGRGNTTNRLYTYGVSQDRGEEQRRPDSTNSPTEWRSSADADGVAIAVDPTDPRRAYASRNGGFLLTTNAGGSRETNWVTIGTGLPRSTWRIAIAPTARTNVFVLQNPATFFAPGPNIYRSQDSGTNFIRINGFGANAQCLALSPMNANLLWVGLDSGQVQYTTKALTTTLATSGADWTQPPRPAPGRPVGAIAIDPDSNATVVVVYEGFSGAAPPAKSQHVFLTTDSGAHWSDISGTNGGSQNLPDLPLHSVVIDPGTSPHSIIVASDAGVMRSADLGQSWQRLGYGLPIVDCTSLAMDSSSSNSLLRVGTYGRSAFELKAAAGPLLSVNGSLAFTNICLGGSQDRDLSVSNAGSATLTVTNITSSDASFQLLNLPSFPLTLAAGSSSSFTLRFAPNRLGTNTSTIRMDSNDQFQPRLLLTASGVGIQDGDQHPGFVIDPSRDQGADRPSDFDWRVLAGLTNGLGGTAIVADDFRSDGKSVPALRWWGSYINGGNAGDEDGYIISFFSDVPAGGGTNFSRPGALLGTYVAPASAVRTYRTLYFGLDQKYIFEYNLNLSDTALVAGAGTNATPSAFLGVSNNIYWVSITAEIGYQVLLQTNGNSVSFTNQPSNKLLPLDHFWGWHTSPCTNLDASVTGAVQLNGTNFVYQAWLSNSVYGLELDQAFEVLTNRFGPATNPAPFVKLVQRPNLTTNGLDVLATENLLSASYIVADDFKCNLTGPITAIRVWGSWLNDIVNSNAGFELRIWSDVPAGTDAPYSHPGQALWNRTFGPNPGNLYYDYGLAATNVAEGFLDPSNMVVGADSMVFQYNFHIATNEAFVQTRGTTYWLSVTLQSSSPFFGWKTAVTNDHFQDSAVYSGTQVPTSAGQWAVAQYPPGHALAGQPMDMAFALTTTVPPGDIAAAGVGPKVLGASTRGDPNRVYVNFDKPVVLASGSYLFSITNLAVSRSNGVNASEVVIAMANAIPPNTSFTLTVQDVTDQEVPANVMAPNPTNLVIYQGPGAFCTDFSAPAPVETYYGSASLPGDGILHLTDAAVAQTGSLVIDPGYNGAPAGCFTARYKLRIGGGTAAPGMGHSFCFGNLPAGPFGEQGIGTNLVVSFLSGAGSPPAIDVKWNNVTVGHVLHSVSQGTNGNSFYDVLIELTDSGAVTVQYHGDTIYDGLQLPDYTPINGPKFGLGARTTPAFKDNHWVDDLCLDNYTLGPVTITQNPGDQRVLLGQPATFVAQVDGSPCFEYQWYADGFPIPGANSRIYTTPATTAGDDWTVFTLVAANSLGETNSLPAVLHVVPTTNPPVLVSVGSLNGSSIGACFSAALDLASAQNQLNYSINGGLPGQGIASVTLRFGEDSVNIQLSTPVAAGFLVSASGISDAYGNVGGGVAAGQVAGLLDSDVGVPGDPDPPGEVFTCTTGTFEVTTGGSGIEATNDGEHFVYVVAAGNFDLRALVDGLEFEPEVDDPTAILPKAGLQARESLAAGSKTLQVLFTPPSIEDSIETSVRDITDGPTTNWPGGCSGAGCNLDDTPWLRLVRTGNHFDAYHSADGTNWTLLGSTDHNFNSNLVVGLATTATSDDSAATATFSGFSLSYTPGVLRFPLTIVQDHSGNVTVSWSQPGYRLQKTTRLVAPPATNVWTVVGSNSPLLVPRVQVVTNNAFFRLISP